MKSLKKEIITIVALLAVALIGTYVVNASTGSSTVKKPVIEKPMAAAPEAVENNVRKNSFILSATGSYCGCTRPVCSPGDCPDAWTAYADCLEACINSGN